MAILKRKPVSFTDKFAETLEWVENQPFNFSKYVCELITKDMLEKQKESQNKVVTKTSEPIKEEKIEVIEDSVDNTGSTNNANDKTDEEVIKVENADLDNEDVDYWS